MALSLVGLPRARLHWDQQLFPVRLGWELSLGFPWVLGRPQAAVWGRGAAFCVSARRSVPTGEGAGPSPKHTVCGPFRVTVLSEQMGCGP